MAAPAQAPSSLLPPILPPLSLHPRSLPLPVAVMKIPFTLLAFCLLLLGARAALGAGCPFTAGTLGQQPVNEIDKFPADGDAKWKMPKMTKPSSCSAEEYETIARELVVLAEVGSAVCACASYDGSGKSSVLDTHSARTACSMMRCVQ